MSAHAGDLYEMFAAFVVGEIDARIGRVGTRTSSHHKDRGLVSEEHARDEVRISRHRQKR